MQIDESSSVSVGRGVGVWTVVRTGLGIILIAAAILKGHEVATGPFPGKSWLEQEWALAAAVALEATLGAWLLSGLNPRWAWRGALAAFAVFLCVASYLAWSGAESCGCFGRVRVNPWYTAAFDLVALIAIATSRRSALSAGENALPFIGLRRTLVSVVAGISLGFAGFIATRASPVDAEADGMVRAQGFMVLEPQKWVDKPFPLARYIDIRPELMRGRWIVLLYRSECDHCRKAIPKYEELAQRRKEQPDLPAVAFVELPPYAPPDRRPVGRDTAATIGRLSDVHDWFIQTPVRVNLNNGIVTAIGEGPAAENP